MKETGMYIDSKDFDKKFYDLVKQAIPGDAQKGLFDAMNELLNNYAIKEAPQCPKDIGDLWGSTAGTVKVEAKHKLLAVSCGFNSKYARRHHEVLPGTFKYTTTKGATQPGPKFLEAKMVRHKNDLMGIVAETIRRKGK